MAATGFTPISLYYTTTASAAPTAGNLVAGELAINTNDGVIYYKDSSGVVQSIASKATNSGSFTNLAYTGTLTGGTGVVNLGSGQFYKDASGNVGIGTSSPNKKLHVSGEIRSTGYTIDTNTGLYNIDGTISNFSSSNGVYVNGNAAGWLSCAADGSQFTNIRLYGASFSGSPNVIAFSTNNAERMRIDSSGNVLLGQSALPFSNANFADGSIYINGNSFLNNSSGTSQYNVRFDGFSDQLFVVWSNGNTQNNSIYYAYGGTAWVNSSDETLKDIIEPITNAVDKVSQLRSVIGKFKTEKEGVRHPFLIAQDVQKVLPEAVYVNKSRVEGEPDTLGVGYTDVIPLLVSAIQELNDKVTALEAKLGAK